MTAQLPGWANPETPAIKPSLAGVICGGTLGLQSSSPFVFGSVYPPAFKGPKRPKKKIGSPLIITRGNEARAGSRAAGHGAELISCKVPGRWDGRRCAQMFALFLSSMKLAISWGKLGLVQTQANNLCAPEGKAGAERHDALDALSSLCQTAPRGEGEQPAWCSGCRSLC